MNPVVINTNCLLQIISRHSPYRPIWDAIPPGLRSTPFPQLNLVTLDEFMQTRLVK
ncbi:MAG: hypothetical protein K6G92_12630 [Bacteroidaceae bacterium]|nr:hypothetical protein [Bacteroidaceae bacterium]